MTIHQYLNINLVAHTSLRLALYCFASGLVLFVFLSKWSLLDGTPYWSFEYMLNGTAYKPVAYRVLTPSVVTALNAALPEGVTSILSGQIAPHFKLHFVDPLLDHYEPIIEKLRYHAESSWSRPSYRSSYVVCISLMFIAMVATLFCLRQLAIEVGAGKLVRELAPFIFCIILPTTFLCGGFAYDFPELYFLTTATLAALRRKWLVFVLIIVVSQLNKETTLLLPIFLLPIIQRQLPLRQARFLAAGVISLCIPIYLYISYIFARNPVLQLSDAAWTGNVAFWTTSTHYLAIDDFFGLGLSIPRMTFLMIIVTVLVFKWRKCDQAIFKHCVFALVTLATVCVLFGNKDEFRNFSLAFPALYILAVSKRGIVFPCRLRNQTARFSNSEP